MNPDLLKKLMALISGGGPQSAPPASPDEGINAARPWDSPVLQPPAAATPPTPTATPLPTAPAQVSTPEEEALIRALQKKKINQQFARATNNPIPG